MSDRDYSQINYQENNALLLKGENDSDEELDLKGFVVIFRRRFRSLIGVSVLVWLALYVWTVTRPPLFQGQFSLLVEPVSESTQLGSGFELGESSEALDYTSQILILRSEFVLVPILDSLQSKLPELTLGRLRGGLSIQRDGSSKVINVLYSSDDFNEVSVVLEALQEGYLAYSVEDRQSGLERSRRLVAKQIDAKQLEVSQSELRLESFQKRYDLINTSEASAAITQRINATLAEIQANQVAIEAAQARFKNLQGQIGLTPSEAVVASNLSEAPIYQDLLLQFRDLESQIALESARYRQDSPIVVSLVEKRNHLLPLLEAEAKRILGNTLAAESGTNVQSLGFQGTVGLGLVQDFVGAANEIKVLQARSQALDSIVINLTADLDTLSGLSREFKELQRDLSLSESSLSLLLSTYEELGLEIVRQTEPWKVVLGLRENLVTEVKPGIQRYFLITLLSVVSGIGASLLLEKLDTTYHSVDVLTSSTGLPVLATIPFNRQLLQADLAMNISAATSMEDLLLLAQEEALTKAKSYKNSGYYGQPFEEAFFALEANLRLLSTDSQERLYVVSSSIPGEGKTTVAVHLAIAASKVGRKVLLIDCDLRAPRVSSIMGLSGDAGLVDYLVSSDRADGGLHSVDSQIKKFSQNPNLFVLPAGKRPPAPTKLLSSQKFCYLLEELKEIYDLIILDSPPLINFADAKLILNSSDGLILTARLNKTDRDNLSKSIADLAATNLTSVVGIVVNGVAKNSKEYYYSSYYYGRGRTAG